MIDFTTDSTFIDLKETLEHACPGFELIGLLQDRPDYTTDAVEIRLVRKHDRKTVLMVGSDLEKGAKEVPHKLCEQVAVKIISVGIAFLSEISDQVEKQVEMVPVYPEGVAGL